MSAMDINSPQLQSYQVGLSGAKPIQRSTEDRVQILERMKELGLSKRDFSWSETKYLPQIIHPHEHLGGVVVGKSDAGHVLFAATNYRLIFLDTKPMFVHSDDISYDVVGGLSLDWVGWAGTLTIHSPVEEFKLKVKNRKAVEIFRSYVEQKRLEKIN